MTVNRLTTNVWRSIAKIWPLGATKISQIKSNVIKLLNHTEWIKYSNFITEM